MERLSTIKIALESFTGNEDIIIAKIIEIWGQVKVSILVPSLRTLMYVSLALSVMLFIEMGYMWMVIAFNYLFGRKMEKRYKWEEFKEDAELGSSVYPLVLIQIPMFNEKEVYQLSIGAACGLSWPADRMVIQVLDDSTDPVIKGLVEMECEKWASKGTNIHYQVRDNRKGYKAGALKEGLEHGYANECDYVAIFDADFQPTPDFLLKTIPFLHHNSELGLVQARWKFVNSDECLMTRIQEMSLNYHFKVEQESGSSIYAFFGFNGTAGVWRMDALNEGGGWKDRTTVEDMDLAVRASLKGWKFLFLGSIEVKSELPSTLKAYRYQQHRWTCGAANLFRKMAYEIIINEKVTLWKKLHVIYSFFFIRKIVAHIVPFVLYCVVIPACVWLPEVEVPTWGTIYIPTIITIMNAVGTPRSLYLVVFWIVFENAMSLHRTRATFIGLFEAQRVNEWVVTEKHGDASKGTTATRQPGRLGFKPSERSLYLVVFWIVFENAMSLHRTRATFIGLFEAQRVNEWVVTEKHGDASKGTTATRQPGRLGFKPSERLLVLELCMGLILFVSGCYDIVFGKHYYYIYLCLQGITFVVIGLGYVGTHVQNS